MFALDFKLLSEGQVALPRNYAMPQSSQSVKLVPTLLPKAQYPLHDLILKFYLQQWMVLTKVHRVNKFRKSACLAPYIQKKQDLLAAAQNDIDKGFFEFLNKAIKG